MAKVKRKQSPPHFLDYRKYKKFLRKDFDYSCAYCSITEPEWGSFWNFVVEHYKPKSKFPTLKCIYSNLFYACNQCNCHKRDIWPTEVERQEGFHILNPCDHDFSRHFKPLYSGRLRHLTKAAEYTSEVLQLNRDTLVTMRLNRRRARRTIKELEDMQDKFLDRYKRATGENEKKEIEENINRLQGAIEKLAIGIGR